MSNLSVCVKADSCTVIYSFIWCLIISFKGDGVELKLTKTKNLPYFSHSHFPQKKNLLKHFVCSDMRDTVLLPSCQTVSLTCIWVETTLDLLHRYLVMLLLNLLKEPEVLKVIEGCLWPNKVVTKLECAAPSRYWGLFRNGAASLLWRRNCCDAVASSFTAPHSACSSWTQPSTRTPAPRGQTHTK